MGRIMASKTIRSENIAELYLMYKDHKPGKKTRPTATGHSSGSLGLSNAVAEVLEAVSNSETHRYNTISTEDMLARIMQYNKSVKEARIKYNEKRVRKLQCRKCQIMEYIDCPSTEDHNWEAVLEGDHSGLESEKLIQNKCCGKNILQELEQECQECGEGIKEVDNMYCVLGNDVKALYPSIESESTGKIIRESIQKSEIEFEGFCFKKGLTYIAMNKNLTTDIEEIEHLLPTRKNKTSTELKMSAVTTRWNPDQKFEFKNQELTKQEQRQVIGRVVEIATRTLF